MVKPKLLLFFGAVRSGEFESLWSRGISLGLLLDKNYKAPLPDLRPFKVVESYDFRLADEGLIAVIEKIAFRWEITMMNVYEPYVLRAAVVAEKLGFRGVPKSAAILCSDKSLMKERFLTAIGEEATAKFRIVSSEEDLVRFQDAAGFPIILKPKNLYGSLFVTLNANPEELLSDYHAIVDKIKAYAEKNGALGQDVAIQAEEYLSGSNHSVDCLCDDKGQVYATPVVDVLTGRDLGLNDFHHFARIVPSSLAPAAQQEIQALAAEGVSALGLKNAVSHVEFVYTKNGPRILEIGARPGGNRTRLLYLGYRIDLIYAYYQVLQGQAPQLTAADATPTAIVTPFPKASGRLKGIKYLQVVERLDSYFHHEVKAEQGEAVGPAREGHLPALKIELQNRHIGRLYEDIESIKRLSEDLFVLKEESR
jgi:phosphoribosylamine-glycine ligase